MDKHVDNIVSQIVQPIWPTQEEYKKRMEVYFKLRNQFKGKWHHCNVYLFGSVRLRTFLPDGDIDVVIIGDHRDSKFDNPSIYTEIQYFLDKLSARHQKLRITKPKIVTTNNSVIVMRFEWEGIKVDLTVNKVDALAKLCFMEMVNHDFMRNNLFKRSAILIKAWVKFETEIQKSGLSTYAIEVMIIHILKSSSNQDIEPIRVLQEFLNTYADLDWGTKALGRKGIVDKARLDHFDAAYQSVGLSVLDECMDYCSIETNGNKFPDVDGEFQVSFLNIVNPLIRNENLGFKVDKPRKLKRIQDALKKGKSDLSKILGSITIDNEGLHQKLLSFFPNIACKWPSFDETLELSQNLTDVVADFASSRRCRYPDFHDLPPLPPLPPPNHQCSCKGMTSNLQVTL